MKRTLYPALAVLTLAPLWAQPSREAVQKAVQKSLPILQELAAEKEVVRDVAVRNAHPLDPGKIQRIQKEWTTIGVSDLERPYLHSVSSGVIRGYERRIPLMFKCFVLDQWGNVAGTAPQSMDFTHGNMDKFRKCFNQGQGRVYVGPPGLDVSTKIYSVQVSVPVFKGGETIGVLVASLSLE